MLAIHAGTIVVVAEAQMDQRTWSHFRRPRTSLERHDNHVSRIRFEHTVKPAKFYLGRIPGKSLLTGDLRTPPQIAIHLWGVEDDADLISSVDLL